MYAVIEIPIFPLQALLRQMPQKPKGPLAVLDESGEQSYVVCTNSSARESEVSEGMGPAKALARCGELQMFPQSMAAESDARRILTLLAQTLSPRIEETEPGMVTVDLRGTQEKDLEFRMEQLVERFRSLGLFVRIGIADTPDYALWAAFFAKWVKRVRSVDSFLNGLDLAVSGAPADVVNIFKGWGIHTLGQVKGLLREEVGIRLGQRGLNLWDAVSGRRIRLLKQLKTEPRFFRKLELEYRVESLEALMFILKRFVDELAVELQVSYKAAFGFRLFLKLENRVVQEKHIEVPVPSSRASTLFRILETGLENFQAQDSIVGVHLRLDTTEAQARQGDLFSIAMEDVIGFSETADRIAALVGPGQSGSPRLNDTWRPDSFRLEKLDTEIPTEIGPSNVSPSVGLPLERIRPPLPVRVFVEGKEPVALEGTGLKGVVTKAKGPWRQSSDWWDNKPWVRDEWDVELKEGGLFRIFRNGKGWFLEGRYG